MKQASWLRMVCLWVALVLGNSVMAQTWRTDVGDDGGYAAGFVRYPGLGAGFVCAARSRLNRPIIETGWFEVSVAPPWHFQIWFDETLIPASPDQRADLVYFVGQTGYRLPHSFHNELEGGWQVNLPMTDGFFSALAGADRLVLAVGNQASWELPTAGLGPALEKARQYCAATWIVTGHNPPPGFGRLAAPTDQSAPETGAFQLPTQVQDHANKQCLGVASFGPEALQAGDLDGDGLPDVVMDWGLVRCNGQSMRGFCGAANCSFDVFMSSRGYIASFSGLATSMVITPHQTGRLGIVWKSAACFRAGIDCSAVRLWNGTNFDP